jgi:hypothetical protein
VLAAPVLIAESGVLRTAPASNPLLHERVVVQLHAMRTHRVLRSHVTQADATAARAFALDETRPAVPVDIAEPTQDRWRRDFLIDIPERAERKRAEVRELRARQEDEVLPCVTARPARSMRAQQPLRASNSEGVDAHLGQRICSKVPGLGSKLRVYQELRYVSAKTAVVELWDKTIWVRRHGQQRGSSVSVRTVEHRVSVRPHVSVDPKCVEHAICVLCEVDVCFCAGDVFMANA